MKHPVVNGHNESNLRHSAMWYAHLWNQSIALWIHASHYSARTEDITAERNHESVYFSLTIPTKFFFVIFETSSNAIWNYKTNYWLTDITKFAWLTKLPLPHDTILKTYGLMDMLATLTSIFRFSRSQDPLASVHSNKCGDLRAPGTNFWGREAGQRSGPLSPIN